MIAIWRDSAADGRQKDPHVLVQSIRGAAKEMCAIADQIEHAARTVAA
jgi:hypothetical protein